MIALMIGLILLSAYTNQCYASPSPSDDAWNPVVNDRYYEMWYFDAQTEAGETIIGGIAVMGNIERDARVRIDLIIYTADGGMIDATCSHSFSDFHASTQRLDISVGDSFAREDPPYYEVFLSNGTISCYLTYNAELPMWKKTKLRQDSYGAWIVIFPRGTVSGWYSIAGEKHEITGVGYHDHAYFLAPTVDGYTWMPNLWIRIIDEGAVIVLIKAPMNYQVMVAFYPNNIYELSRVRVEMGNNSLQITGCGENSVAYLRLTISRQDLMYKSEAWEAYRGLFSANGYLVSATLRSPIKGKGIIYFPVPSKPSDRLQ
jgi:hypothetical protein